MNEINDFKKLLRAILINQGDIPKIDRYIFSNEYPLVLSLHLPKYP